MRLVLDPELAFDQGIDLARVGGSREVAPSFALRSGALRRLGTGPAGVALVAQAGPLELESAPVSVPADAVTVSLWTRALAPTAPAVSLLAGDRVLASDVAGPGWTPLRAPASALRGSRLRLTVASPDAAGLELAWLGTIQRAPQLQLAPLQRRGAVLHVGLRASRALAGARVWLQRRAAAGGAWLGVTRVLVGADGSSAALVRSRARTTLRWSFSGSEAVAPGYSGVRTVRAAKQPKPKP